MKKVLRRMFAFTTWLQWKLTLAYTLVTVVVVAVLLVVSIFLGNFINYNYLQSSRAMANALSKSAENLAETLAAPQPDLSKIQDWVDNAIHKNNIALNTDTQDLSGTFSSMVDPQTVLAVLDAKGQVLASNHPELLANGAMITPNIPLFGQELLARAQGGETRISQLLYQADMEQLAIAPIRGDDGEMLGMVFLLLRRPTQLSMFWFSLIAILPVIGLSTIPAALVGSLFGAVTARGLANRLKRATQATSAWGQGDFSVRIKDNSQDEIGQLAQSLNQMASQLQELLRTRQELAALEERNRLARDLHDSVKQQVFATSMNLAAVNALWERSPEEAFKRLEIAANLTRQSQQELTTLIQTLRPIQLERRNLAQALTQTLREWENQTGIKTTCQITENGQPLSDNLQQALFRVVQEGLSNVHRHSGASRIEVLLDEIPPLIHLKISDNGHGFDPAQANRGLGLRSMYERISALGGTLQIESNVNGTQLIATVPVDKEPDHV